MTHDTDIDEALARHCQTHNLTPLDAVKLFPVLARRQWLKRFLAHHELFKMTLDIPGDICELGVYKGLGLFTWANFLEMHAIGDRTKIVYGFDSWGGLTGLSEKDNRAQEGEFKSTLEEIDSAIKIFDGDRFMPSKRRIIPITGNIEETVPDFISRHQEIRFSLVHFDCDLYRPTKIALEAIWPKVSRGGLALFDEYAIHDWPGETCAVDEFFADKTEVKIKKLTWNNVPGGYVIK